MSENIFKIILKRIKNIMVICFHSIWFWLAMLLPVAVILVLCSKYIHGFADFYCNNIYRFVSLFWNNVSGIIPFSVAEVLVLCLPLLVITYIVFIVVKTVKTKNLRKKILLKGLARIISAVCALSFLYMTNCGINYYCSDFAAQSGLEVKETSTDELYEVCIYLAENASECRKKIKEDSSGHMLLDKKSSYSIASSAVNDLHNKYTFIPDGYSVPKSVWLSRGMSYLNITGIYFPFTFEANVNTDVPDFCVPFSMCHELAHIRGFMHEQDANFISYLSCIYSGNYEFMYSGYLSAMIYASNALYSSDSIRFSAFLEYISDDVFDDLNEYSEYWSKFETPVAEAASALNDTYLKSNSQNTGINSYGEMTDLVIAHYFKEIVKE